MKCLCLSNRFYYNEMNKEDVECIKYDLKLYNKMLHKSYRTVYDMYFHNLKMKSVQKYIKDIYGTNDYYPLSAINEARGILKSNIETNKRLQKLYKQRIKNIENKMSKTEKERKYYENLQKILILKSKDGNYTEKDCLYEVKEVKPKIKELRNREKMLKYRLNRYNFKLKGLEKRVKQCCFGGKKNLNNDKEKYFLYRRNRMFIPGRRQGKYSNNIFKYHIENETMQIRTSNKDIYLPVIFHHNKEELVRVVSLPHNTAGKAVAYELRDYGEYFIIKAIIEFEDKNIPFNKTNGVIGLDLNVDHFAIVETNETGNIGGRKVVRYKLKGKTTNQRKDILRNKVKKVVSLCKEKNKPLVIEDLGFDKKKSKMMYQNKRSNQQLSEFAYKRIREMIESRTYKDEVCLKTVNPAYTSQIGKKKYMKDKGMSIHEAAGYVIARRGQYGMKADKL